MNTSYYSQRTADDADLAHPILHKVPSSAAFEVQSVLQPGDVVLQSGGPTTAVLGRRRSHELITVIDTVTVKLRSACVQYVQHHPVTNYDIYLRCTILSIVTYSKSSALKLNRQPHLLL